MNAPTLATLHLFTLQQIYDHIARAIYEQGYQSRKGPGCAYRGDFGRKCAAGQVISDEEYRDEMEGHSIFYLLSQRSVYLGLDHDALPPVGPRTASLLRATQDVHDHLGCLSEDQDYFREKWLGRMWSVAESFSLDPWTPPA